MVNPVPPCSICTRQNGLQILANGTVEVISNPDDRFKMKTCPETYQCIATNADYPGNFGCCQKCPPEYACPEGAVGQRFQDNQCPDGYTCDPLPQKCAIGEACVSNTVTNCTRAQGLLANFGYGDVLSGTYCEEGTAFITNCPTGYYCPNARDRIICPKGFYCPMKSKAPELKCSLCDEGSMQPQRDVVSLVIFLGVFVIIIILYVFVRARIRPHSPKNDPAPTTLSVASDGSMNTGTCTHMYHQTTHKRVNWKDMSYPSVTIKYQNITVTRNIKSDRSKSNKAVVLNNVSGALYPGRLCAILGESGAGKSTLLGALSGQMQAEARGTICINEDPLAISHWIGCEATKKITATVPQEDVLHNDLSVFENLYWSGRFLVSSSKTDSEVRDQVNDKLEMLGLLQVRDHQVKNISGGEKRRTSLGVALMVEPRVLFCDEVTSGLDASTSLIVISILKRCAVQENITIIVSIHQPRQSIFELFDDLTLLGRGGRVLYQGSTNQVTQYFESIGYTCPQGCNLSDFLLDLSTQSKKVVESDDPKKFYRKLSDEWEGIPCSQYEEQNIADTGTLPKLKMLTSRVMRPNPGWQLYFQLRKNINILQRNRLSVLTITFVICLASATLTLVQGPLILVAEDYEYYLSPEDLSMENFPLSKMFEFSAVPVRRSQQFALTIALGVGPMVALAASKSMSDQKANVLREVNSGINISAYFIAISIISIFVNGAQMILAGTLSYWLRVPLQSYTSYVVNFFALQFGCVSWGHFITALVPPDNLSVIVGTLMLSSGLLCSGHIPPITMFKIYNSKMTTILVGLATPVRFFVETFVVSDCMCIPQQYGFTVSSHYGDGDRDVPPTILDAMHLAMNDRTSTRSGTTCKVWYYGSARLLVVSLMIRALTLLVINFTYQQHKGVLLRFNSMWIICRLALIGILLYISVTLILN